MTVMGGFGGAARLPFAAVVAAALMMSACSDGSRTATNPTLATGGPVSSAEAPLVPSGNAPVLTTGMFAWSAPQNWLPRDLPSVAVYPDGTVIRVDDTTQGSVSLVEMSFTPAEVEEILRVADSAGLGSATALPSEPSPIAIEDGGWSIITRRSDAGVGTAIVDQPCVDRDAPASERRGRLCALVGLVGVAYEREGRTLPIERWVIESAGPLPDLASTPWPWSDLDPNSLQREFNAGGVRCAIVDGTYPPYTYEESSNGPALIDGIFRRPLLPHESTCADVFAWRAALGMETAMYISPPSLDASVYRYDTQG
jgi:hypothetical protein